jgi:hypothetical protein
MNAPVAHPLAAARRKSLLTRFARLAAARISAPGVAAARLAAATQAATTENKNEILRAIHGSN